MDTAIEKVKPEIINGIEFYISADESIAGCSRPGIAMLCGVTAQSIAKLIDSYSQYDAPTSTGSNRLKALLQEPYYPQLIGVNGALILKEEVCIALIEYYAFHSPNKSEVAMFSFRKFAAMGWRSWVLGIAGRNMATVPQSLVGAIREELKQLRHEVRELTNVKRVAQKSHPGLGILVEEYGKGQLIAPIELPEPFTYSQWATVAGQDSRDLGLRRRVAECVKSLRGVRMLHKTRNGNVMYYHSDLPAFSAALTINVELAII